MDFYEKVGKMALGSRIRRLSELLTWQAGEVYALYDVGMQPKWFPVFYVLSAGEEKSIKQIAQEIGHSHASVSTIVKEMLKGGVVEKGTNSKDGRENYVKLTEKGFEVNTRLQAQLTDVGAAVETALKETRHDIWAAIEEWEFLLAQKSLFDRVKQEKKLREGKDVLIVPYQPEYKSAFRQLNEEWITTWFTMEEMDFKALDHPQEYILDNGGHIIFALHNGEPVGTCGLIKKDDHTYELAKMAVSPAAKGMGIGYMLGMAAIQLAKQQGFDRLYLESNTILKPALSLYQKLGFKRIPGAASPYKRSNIAMELDLT